MLPFFGARFGNPSSAHRWGREARAALEEARERLAALIGARGDEICFTSGGTEGDNLAVLGTWRALRDRRRAVVSAPIEHKAVLAAMHEVAHEGGEERWAPTDRRGIVVQDRYEALVDDEVALCSVMWVNNEIGVIQDIGALAATAKSRGAMFHTDAVQALGKVAIDARAVPFDTLTISGHKIGAPKGIGAIFIRRGTPLESLVFGGAQERGRRPGTENIAMAVGFARAAELAVAEREQECTRVAALRDRLEAELVARIPDAIVHGRGAMRAPHILSLSVPGTDSESLLMALDLAGIAASSGSACQSGSVEPSHVLTALGVPADLGAAAIRMSLGALTTDDAITRVAELFPSLIDKARRLGGVRA